MQKNKIDVVKAVCNNVARKLVAICLTMAVVGATIIDGNYGFIANAQEQPQDQEQMERDRLLAKLLDLEDRLRPLSDLRPSTVRLAEIARILMSRLNNPRFTLSGIQRSVRQLEGFTIRHEIAYANGEQDIDCDCDCCLNTCYLVYRLVSGSVNWLVSIWRGIGNFFGAIGDGVRDLFDVIVDGVDDLFDMVRGRGHNNSLDVTQQGDHITAGENSHVYSVSAHDLTHEGAGAALITGPGRVDVDDGEITISECNDDLSRNVTVKLANSLTIAPHVNVNLRNGTEFETGETAQETLSNLVRAMKPRTVRRVMKKTLGQK